MPTFRFTNVSATASWRDPVQLARHTEAGRLAGLYRRGQERAWHGSDVLAELVARLGPPKPDPRHRTALHQIVSVLCWGELAAWRVSAALAAELDHHDGRLAATAQAHDEARHFTVLRDYLALLDGAPAALPPPAATMLDGVVGARDVVRKLLGMQLMVEPVALTLFGILKEQQLDPVLTELLTWIERDEARHVALGVNLLPGLISELHGPALARTWAWQLRMFMNEVAAVEDLAPALRTLGIDPVTVLRQGQARQLAASDQLVTELDRGLPVTELLLRLGEARFAVAFPDDPAAGRLPRVAAAARRLFERAPQARGLPL